MDMKTDNQDIDVLERLLADRFSCRGFHVGAGAARDDRTHARCRAENGVVVQQPAMADCDHVRRCNAKISEGDDGSPPQAAGRATGISSFRANIAVSIWSGVARAAFSFTTRSASPKATKPLTRNRRWRILISSGAPHVAIVHTDEALGVYGAVDCGGYVTSLMLAAQALGLATVPQAALAFHSDIVRQHLGLGDDRKVVCGISFGYADREHKANGYRTKPCETARRRDVRRLRKARLEAGLLF